jgi:hypothetical protein
MINDEYLRVLYYEKLCQTGRDSIYHQQNVKTIQECIV